MPYIKPLVDERWIVYTDIGNYLGLLMKDGPAYTFFTNNNGHESTNKANGIHKFKNKDTLVDFFGEDITDNEVQKRNSTFISEIKGFPLNFGSPIMIEHTTLPVYKKSSASDVIYCAGYYCMLAHDGWRRVFCPKLSTLEHSERWEGPFKTEIEMLSVLNAKKS